MENFGELLKQYIQEQNLLVYRLANETGIDRTLIQNVMSGKKKFKVEDFKKIVNADYFTSKQLHILSEAYCAELFGEQKMQKFAYIEKGLSGKVKKELQKEFTPKAVEVKKDTLYSGRENVLSVIYEIANSKTDELFSNFPFSKREISAIIYNACKNGKVGNLFHIVMENDGEDCNNIEIVFNSVHFAEIGFYTYRGDTRAVDSFFPYYILTDNYLLEFDDDMENAFLASPHPLLEYMQKDAESLVNSDKNVATIFNDAFDMLERLTKFSFSDMREIFTLNNIFCAASITPEIINTIATPLIKSVPEVAARLISYYSVTRQTYSLETIGKYGDNVKTKIITYEAVDDFVKTGRLAEYPEKYAAAVPTQMREQMIRNMFETENVNFLITNPNYFSSEYKYSLESSGGIFYLLTTDKLETPDDFIGHAAYIGDRDVLSNDFKEFIEYISISEKTYSKSVSKDVAKMFIANLSLRQ